MVILIPLNEFKFKNEIKLNCNALAGAHVKVLDDPRTPLHVKKIPADGDAVVGKK